MAIDTASLDFMIDRIAGPASPAPGIELGALLALWAYFKEYVHPVDALDCIQRRLVERGYLAS